MWTWDQITQSFEELSRHPRPSWEQARIHARAMLQLIPKIRGVDSLSAVQPFLSHATLCISFPGREEIIGIYAENSDTYSVSFFTRTQAEPFESKIARLDEVVQLLCDEVVKI